MAIQSTFYTGTALETRTFPSTKHIATKQHMAVWRQEVADPQDWVQMDIGEYQLITNACVLNTLLSTTLYSDLEVRVADAPDELVSSPSDITIVAGIEAEVVTVAGIADEVIIVANNDANVTLVGDDLALGAGTNQPEDSAILNALTNATDSATSAGESSDSADAASTSETNAELFEWEAEAERLTADSYATEAEDTKVNIVTSDGDGTFTYTPQTGIYSALHWAAKSATFNPALYALLTGATFTGNLLGITPTLAAHLTRKDYVDDGVANRRKLYAKEPATITPDADADYTLTADENLYGRLTLADGSWTATHNIIVDTSIREIVVDNTNGTYDATVKTSAGTGVIVLAGHTSKLYCDGTNVVKNSFGIGEGGQTSQILTGSRNSGSTYTNSTGKPIYVSVYNTAGTIPEISFYLDGDIVESNLIRNSETSGYGSVSSIVPNGSEYKVNSNTAIARWTELR